MAQRGTLYDVLLKDVLRKQLNVINQFEFGGITYKFTADNVEKAIKDLDEPLKDKEVLVVEDIVDSGRTLSYLLEMLKDRGPKSVRLCTLLDKPDRRVVDVNVDYTGFSIPDEFSRLRPGPASKFPPPVRAPQAALPRGYFRRLPPPPAGSPESCLY